MKQVKKSIKPIPLSYRGKKRYILFELISEKRLNEKDVSRELWNTFLRLFGEVGCAKAKIWPILFDGKKNRGIIRCANEGVEEAKAAILFLRDVNGVGVIPRILLVSGSLKKLKEKK